MFPDYFYIRVNCSCGATVGVSAEHAMRSHFTPSGELCPNTGKIVRVADEDEQQKEAPRHGG